MTLNGRDIPNVAGLEIERLRRFGRAEDGHTCLSLEVIVPFVRSWVPVDFTHRARVDGNKGGSEVVGDGEGGRVDNLDGSARDFIWLLLREVVRVPTLLGNDTVGTSCILLSNVLRCRCTREDVELSPGNIGKRRDIGAEVLGQDFFGLAKEEFRGQECTALVKVALVEDQEELNTALKGLYRVRDTGREEPNCKWLATEFSAYSTRHTYHHQPADRRRTTRPRHCLIEHEHSRSKSETTRSLCANVVPGMHLATASCPRQPSSLQRVARLCSAA